MQSKQKTNLPQKFIQFINTIIEAQTQTDTWKSKLFYVPVDDVCRILMEFGCDGGDNNDNSQQQQQNQTTNQWQQRQQHTNNKQQQQHHITLSSILTFIQTTSQCDLTQQQQKVIQKYFNFSQKLSCTKQQFIKRLKPINNKLILSIEKQQIQTKELLNKLFKSILQGYEKINPLRNQCAQLFLQIKKYFHTQQLHKSSCKTLSKQALKQFMFEADIYGRVNFAYVKDYVFGGDNRDEIEWSVLLGMRDNGELERLYENMNQQKQQQNKNGQLLLSQQQVRINNNIKNKQRQLQELLSKGKFEEIVQLQEENIVTEKVILGNVNQGYHYQQRQQQQQQQQQQEQDGQQQQKQRQQQNQSQQLQQLQHQSQQQVQPSTITTTQTQLITTKTTTKQQHKQITEIEQLLNRTKQRYQKNKEQLQNQAINIKNQQQQQQQSSILLNRKQSGRFAYTSRVNQIYQQIKYDKMRMESSSNNSSSRQQQQQQVQKPSVKKLQLQQQKHSQQKQQQKQSYYQPTKEDDKYHHQSLTTTPIKQSNNVFSHKISQQLQQQLVQHKNKYNNKKQKYKLSQQQLQQQQQHQQIKLHTPSPLNDNTHTIINNKNNNMQQSLVKPLFTRQAMRKEIYDTLRNSNEINDYFNVNNSDKIGASEEIRFDQTHGAIITPSYQSTQRREVGKIKRRSVSKDVGVGNNYNNNTYTPSAITTPTTTTTPINSLAKTFTFPQQEKQPRNNNYYSSINSINNNKNTNITNYHQYEAVLKEIKKQQNQYKNILDAREKIIGDKQKQTRKKRLTLDNVGVGSKINSSPQSSGIYKRYTPINSLLQGQKSQKPHKQSSILSQYTQQQRVSASMQKPAISHSRYEEIMKEIQTNSLARSRVSSKKRQEIVQKATSQARLRIQQIQNRALKRLAKVDSTERYSVSKKSNNYLNLDSTVEVDKQYQMPKYRKTKQNPTSTVNAVAKSQKSSSPKNYFMNDMLNERPTGLKLTSNYRQKY